MSSLFWIGKLNETKLEEWCASAYKIQVTKQQHFFDTQDKILIRDKEKKYKIVTMHYYNTRLKETDFDTEEELVDEEDWNEEQRILKKYS